MKYYINGKKEASSYVDVLDFVCRVCTFTERQYYWSVVTSHKFDASKFLKNYRHNDNDGTWSSFRWQYKYDWIRVFDEDTLEWKYVKEKVSQTLVPPQLTQKQYQIKDEFGRILNSKDLIRDALKHDYDPDRERKARRKLFPDYRWCSYSRYQKGHNWQKYLGDHPGPVAVKKSFVYAEYDQKEVLEEYGTTFKIRNKRKANFRDLWDFDHGWLEKGWKQTRKKKQWM